MQKSNTTRKTRTPKWEPLTFPYQVYRWCTGKKCNKERQHIERVVVPKKGKPIIIYECMNCCTSVQIEMR